MRSSALELISMLLVAWFCYLNQAIYACAVWTAHVDLRFVKFDFCQHSRQNKLTSDNEIWLPHLIGQNILGIYQITLISTFTIMSHEEVVLGALALHGELLFHCNINFSNRMGSIQTYIITGIKLSYL